MRTMIVGLLLLIMLGFSIKEEPLDDTVDMIAGASTETYGPTIDTINGVSIDDDDEEDEEDEEDDD